MHVFQGNCGTSVVDWLKLIHKTLVQKELIDVKTHLFRISAAFASSLDNKRTSSLGFKILNL